MASLGVRGGRKRGRGREVEEAGSCCLAANYFRRRAAAAAAAFIPRAERAHKIKMQKKEKKKIRCRQCGEQARKRGQER